MTSDDLVYEAHRNAKMAEAVIKLVMAQEPSARSAEDKATLGWAMNGVLELVGNAAKILDEVV